MTLTAKFSFELDGPLHIYSFATCGPVGEMNLVTEEDKAEFVEMSLIPLNTVVDGIEVRLWLRHELVDNPLIKGHLAPGVRYVDMELSSDVEAFTDPDTPEYRKFRERYREVAYTVMNRLIEYFKYEKGNPFLRPLNAGHCTKWDWYDQDNTLLYAEPRGTIMARFPGLRGALDSTGLRMSELDSLTTALGVSRDVIVVDELRAQAREAIFEGNFLLAVLLLAVSVEVKVKTAFLGSNSAASNAFDYSQEKGRVEISPIEFIDKIAKLTFNESFKAVNKEANKQIEYLFRCRNKVAHRGQGIYSDETGAVQSVDRETLYLWWDSVSQLMTWLAEKTDAPDAIEIRKPFSEDNGQDGVIGFG